MSYLYNSIRPAVIDEKMLKTAVEEQGPKEKAGEIARAEGIEFNDVRFLQLDYKNIMVIQGLYEFTRLTKLQLDNNIIERIEGIDMLVNLEWLDLSFNNIEVIEGLDTLTKLEDLTLYNNRIRCIENMDSLVNLHVFSIGNNDLQQLENLAYLRRFKNLKTLNLSNNPFCELDVYGLYVAAILPNLVYLDYKLMHDQLRADGYERFQIPVEELLDNEKKMSIIEEEKRKEDEELAFHATAFVPHLNGSQLFHSLYENDPEGNLLNTLPDGEEMLAVFEQRLTAICKTIFEFGLEAYKTRQAEVDLFLGCLREAKDEDREQGMKHINEFKVFKDVHLRQLAQLTDARLVQKYVMEYNAKVTGLWNTLVEAELHLVEQLEEIVQNFDLSLQEHVSHFCENVQGYMSKIREEESLQVDRVNSLVNDHQDNILRGDIEVSQELQALMADKDGVTNFVATSHDTHMLVIDTKEDSMVSGINKWATNLIDKIHQEEEVSRNRTRVCEIIHLIDQFREDLNNVEMLNASDEA